MNKAHRDLLMRKIAASKKHIEEMKAELQTLCDQELQKGSKQ